MNLKEFKEKKVYERLLKGEKFLKYESKNAKRPYCYNIDIKKSWLHDLQIESPYLLRIEPNQDSSGYILSIYAQYDALNLNFMIGQAIVNAGEKIDTFSAKDMSQYVEAWLLENGFISRVDDDSENTIYKFVISTIYLKADKISKAYLTHVVIEDYFGKENNLQEYPYQEWLNIASKYSGLIIEPNAND